MLEQGTNHDEKGAVTTTTTTAKTHRRRRTKKPDYSKYMTPEWAEVWKTVGMNQIVMKRSYARMKLRDRKRRRKNREEALNGSTKLSDPWKKIFLEYQRQKRIELR